MAVDHAEGSAPFGMAIGTDSLFCKGRISSRIEIEPGARQPDRDRLAVGHPFEPVFGRFHGFTDPALYSIVPHTI